MTLSDSKKEQIKGMNTEDLEQRIVSLDKENIEIGEEYRAVAMELQERRREQENKRGD